MSTEPVTEERSNIRARIGFTWEREFCTLGDAIEAVLAGREEPTR